jgi:hypothetical protein
MANPALVPRVDLARINAELLLEPGDVRLLVAVVRDAFGIVLRVIAHVAGADPVEVQAVDVVAEQFFDEPELVLPHLGECERKLRVVFRPSRRVQRYSGCALANSLGQPQP